MPLPNTVNVSPKFREIGKIRKGITVIKTKTINGKKVDIPYPKEVDYFVMDFLPEERQAEETFWSSYGQEPKELRIAAPFDQIDRWWDAWLRCFKGSRMIANAGLNIPLAQKLGHDPYDTIYFERLFSVEEKRWIVKRWKNLDTGEAMVVDMFENIDKRNGEGLGPVIYTTFNEKTNKDVPYYLTATGTLTVLVRELRSYLGFLSLHTNGKVDVNNISGELAGLQMRADQAGIPLHNLPLVLSRRKEVVRDPDGNKTYHYNLHIGLDADFSRKLALMQDAQRDNMVSGLLGQGTNDAVLPSRIETDQDLSDGYFDDLPDDEPEIIDAELVEDGEDDTVILASYRDFWQYAIKLGIDTEKEKDTINSLWREKSNDPAAAAKAMRSLAGLE